VIGPGEGTVTAFDEGRGRGVITTPDGVAYEFHATRLADGTRRIAVGTKVVFDAVAAFGGRYEASAITRA
jgi:cold shock CspA family protein